LYLADSLALKGIPTRPLSEVAILDMFTKVGPLSDLAGLRLLARR